MGFPDKPLTQRKNKEFWGPQNWIGRLQCGYQAANSLQWLKLGYPLVICYIVIEHDHRNSGFSHESWPAIQ